MILDWVKTVGPILISWPVLGLIAIIMFRAPLLAIANRFTGDDIQRFKIGGVGWRELKLQQIKQKAKLSNSMFFPCQMTHSFN